MPRAKNLSREAEHHCGTSNRDPIAFSYFHVKGLIKLPDALQNYSKFIILNRIWKNPIKLISVFLNFLKEIQESPLEFQPIFSQLSSDAEIFERDEEAQRLNRNYIRVL